MPCPLNPQGRGPTTITFQGKNNATLASWRARLQVATFFRLCAAAVLPIKTDKPDMVVHTYNPNWEMEMEGSEV
jgi:hypothetical protein